MNKKEASLLSLPVIVAALGFFVDIFDLLLFGVVRKPSLESMGLSQDEILTVGERILNVQLIGMVLGGILWGILADKFGRLKVLFGSILMYSLANIANGFVTDVDTYTVIRFIAGFGLAGELGAGITLTSEILPKHKRGLASMIIATFGVFGGISAALLSKVITSWHTLYFIGGGMGLLLLALRLSVKESPLFAAVKNNAISRGNFLQFFKTKERFLRYLKGMLIGMPVWYCIGILIFFGDKFAAQMGIQNVSARDTLLYQYIGLAFGDVSASLLSQYLKSRKKAMYIFYSIFAVFLILFFTQHNGTASNFYFICLGLGFSSGISVLYITTSAEQFGTNLRATAATSITNNVRGFTPLLSVIFQFIRPTTGYINGAWIIGIGVMIIAFVALFYTKESFNNDLDFIEH
jgi:MFS transporter, putative metabolite:H+ symporter